MGHTACFIASTIFSLIQSYHFSIIEGTSLHFDAKINVFDHSHIHHNLFLKQSFDSFVLFVKFSHYSVILQQDS